MRRIFRRYRLLSASQKRVYSLLSLITMAALLLYCLGLGSFLLRSQLVSDVALALPPTFTPTSTPQATTPATAGPTGTPTATLPPTPTQRPIPTYTPTPESVNITIVITSTEGVTSTMVISATVTPTPVLTATVTITAEASLGYGGGSLSALMASAVLDTGGETPGLASWAQVAGNVCLFPLTCRTGFDHATWAPTVAGLASTNREPSARTVHYG